MNTSIAIVGCSPFIPNRGGVERVSEILAMGLKTMGADVFYYNLEKPDTDYSFPVPQFSAPEGISYNHRNLADYHDFLRDKKVDVIINQDGLFSTANFFLNTGESNIRKISVIHSAPFFQYHHLWDQCTILKDDTLTEQCKRIARTLSYFRTKSRIWKSWKEHYKMLSDNNSELCLLSQNYVKDIESLGLQFKRIQIIPNPNTYKEPLNVDWTNKRREVLFVGRLHNRSKQVQILLKIWHNVSPLCRDWTLTIVGSGPDEQVLKNLAQNMGLDRVQFVGRQIPDSYYRRASILCLTSLYEGFGMVLTEAQQHGVACIAFDSYGAVHDIIKDGENGVLVSPFSVQEYTAKLIHLMMDQEWRLSLAEEGKRTVQRFSESRVISQWISYIEKNNRNDLLQ